MMHVWSIIHSERLSGRTNTSLFHRHLRGPLFKNRVGLDDLWATPAPASLSRATTSLSIFPISPVPTIDFRTVMADEVISQGSEFFFFFSSQHQLWTYSSLTLRPIMLGVKVFYKKKQTNTAIKYENNYKMKLITYVTIHQIYISDPIRVVAEGLLRSWFCI